MQVSLCCAATARESEASAAAEKARAAVERALLQRAELHQVVVAFPRSLPALLSRRFLVASTWQHGSARQ